MWMNPFRKNRIRFYETIYQNIKQDGHYNKTVYIIHYDNIAIKEPMRALTEVTLKSLKENREIRQKLGG